MFRSHYQFWYFLNGVTSVHSNSEPKMITPEKSFVKLIRNVQFVVKLGKGLHGIHEDKDLKYLLV